MDQDANVDGYDVTVQEGLYIESETITDNGYTFIREIIANITAAKDFAAEKLIGTYNDSWIDENHDELNSAKFARILGKPTIMIYEEGAAALYFPDGDMFGGHSIEVSYDHGKFKNANIVG